MTDTDYLLQRLREVRTIRVRGGGGRNAVLPPSEIDLEAASEIERLRAEVAEARRTSEYWKAEHNAENEVIESLRAEVATIRNLQTVAESELASLRGRISAAPAGMVNLMDGPERSVWAEVHAETLFDGIDKKRVRLVVDEG